MDYTNPIVEVRIDGNKTTLVNLRFVAAIQEGFSNKVIARIGEHWLDLYTEHPAELVARWKEISARK